MEHVPHFIIELSEIQLFATNKIRRLLYRFKTASEEYNMKLLIEKNQDNSNIQKSDPMQAIN
jgi:hypothetical protein